MAKFKKGELAVLIAKEKDSTTPLGKEIAQKHSGKIVEINSVYTLGGVPMVANCSKDKQWYGITIDDDPTFYAAEFVLDKLPPPPQRIEELGSWDTIRDLVGYKQRDLET